tara:strand:- start:103040 stop:103330 length:291 start_codon:yes stop_codon:yes gene_type:complete
MYIKATLKGSKSSVLADIKSIQKDGEAVYPDYPDGYEVTGSSVFDRYVVTPPRQEVITPGGYAEDGTETTAPVMGDWVSQLVLPAGYDTSHFITSI